MSMDICGSRCNPMLCSSLSNQSSFFVINLCEFEPHTRCFIAKKSFQGRKLELNLLMYDLQSSFCDLTFLLWLFKIVGVHLVQSHWTNICDLQIKTLDTGVFTPQGNQFSSLDSNLPSTSLNHSLDQNFPQAQNLPISQPFGSMGDVNWQGNRDKPPENKLRPGESKNDQSLMHLESLSNFPGFPGLATNEFSGLDMNLSPGQFSLGEQGLSNQFLGSDHNFFQQLPPVQDKNQEWWFFQCKQVEMVRFWGFVFKKSIFWWFWW